MKISNSKNVFVMVCLLLLLTTPCMLDSRTVSEVRYTAEFSQFDLSFSTLDGYDVIHMKEASAISELGEPVLPAKNLAIAIPRGTKAIKVETKSLGSTILPGEFYVLPGQPPIPIGARDVYITEKPDVQTYGSDKPYPGNLVTLDHQSNLAGQQIVWVTIYPLQYIPAEKQLHLHNRIEVVVFCERDNGAENIHQEQYYKFTDNQRRIYENMLKEMVVNPYAVSVNPRRGSPSFIVPPGSFDHVIVTSSALASYFQPLVHWHMKRGMRDTVVTTEWIYANYAGPGDTLQVRQFVMDANTNWGTMYFLMAGEDEIVPFTWRYYYGDYPDQIAPSDQYYSDFDDDWTHEVFVGRASVDNETQINTFINKVLKYEKDPPLTDYPLEVLLIGMDISAGNHGPQYLKDVIASYIPGYFNINKVYDTHGGNHLDSALYYLNSGQHLVNHADHCNQTSMGVGSINHGWHISIGNVDNLINDDKTCTIVSLGCEPNAMDYDDCIAERFVIYNPNQAGIAFIGNTRHGWWAGGSGDSGEIDKWWWRGVFQYDKENHGEALVYSKHEFGNAGNFRKHCEWTFNLLGEPAMPIWTNTPDEFQVSHDPVVPATSGTFTVTVNDDNRAPVEDALVCCWALNQNPQLYATEYTNASGQAVLSISPNVSGDTMFVTTTKHNYLPYEGNALIAPSSGPYIMAATMIIDDGEDGLINPGETIDLGIYARNIGFDPASGVYGLLDESDSYVSVGVDSGWYGNISSTDSTLSNPDYEFSVANNCPNGHIIQFDIEFHDNSAGSWTSHPELRVYAPVLTCYDVAVVNGNDNGILDPGEIADLKITLENEGDATAPSVTGTLITASSDMAINDSLGSFGSINPGEYGDNASDLFTVAPDISIPFGTPIDFSMIIESGVYLDTLNFTVVVGQSVPTDTGYYYAYYSGGQYVEVPVFDWVAIDSTQSTNPGISLDLDRNETAVIPLPFTFKYYGIDYDQISICSNGWITMDSTGSTDFSNTGIPNIDGPEAMIAGIWDYLHPGAADAPGDIYYYHDATNHRFIVEYFQIDHYPSGDPETFEIILHDPAYYTTPTGDGEIIVQYPSGIQKPTSVTVGIENTIETVGIEYFFNGDYDSLAKPVTDSFAIKYTTEPPTPLDIEEYDEFISLPPSKTMLGMVYPNPFTRNITINYQVSQQSRINLVVYDISGRLVRNIHRGMTNPGYYQVHWDGKDEIGRTSSAGVYFVRFNTSDYNKIEKVILLK